MSLSPTYARLALWLFLGATLGSASGSASPGDAVCSKLCDQVRALAGKEGPRTGRELMLIHEGRDTCGLGNQRGVSKLIRSALPPPELPSDEESALDAAFARILRAELRPKRGRDTAARKLGSIPEALQVSVSDPLTASFLRLLGTPVPQPSAALQSMPSGKAAPAGGNCPDEQRASLTPLALTSCLIDQLTKTDSEKYPVDQVEKLYALSQSLMTAVETEVGGPLSSQISRISFPALSLAMSAIRQTPELDLVKVEQLTAHFARLAGKRFETKPDTSASLSLMDLCREVSRPPLWVGAALKSLDDELPPPAPPSPQHRESKGTIATAPAKPEPPQISKPIPALPDHRPDSVSESPTPHTAPKSPPTSLAEGVSLPPAGVRPSYTADPVSRPNRSARPEREPSSPEGNLPRAREPYPRPEPEVKPEEKTPESPTLSPRHPTLERLPSVDAPMEKLEQAVASAPAGAGASSVTEPIPFSPPSVLSALASLGGSVEESSVGNVPGVLSEPSKKLDRVRKIVPKTSTGKDGELEGREPSTKLPPLVDKINDKGIPGSNFAETIPTPGPSVSSLLRTGNFSALVKLGLTSENRFGESLLRALLGPGASSEKGEGVELRFLWKGKAGSPAAVSGTIHLDSTRSFRDQLRKMFSRQILPYVEFILQR